MIFIPPFQVHGPRGVGGRHKLHLGRVPAHRHVRVRPGAVGDSVEVHGPGRAGARVPAAVRGGGGPTPHPGGHAGVGGAAEGAAHHPGALEAPPGELGENKRNRTHY